MILHQTDFELLADKISSDFISDDVPLNKGILKIASERELNKDQIARLVELSNRDTFLKKFATGDRNVVFEVANIDSICDNYYKKADIDIPKPAYDLFQDFTEIVPIEKVASNLEPQQEEEKPINMAMVLARLADCETELNTQMMKVASDYKDRYDTLAAEFANLYGPDFIEFEKTAAQLYGFDCSSILTSLRHDLRLDKVDYTNIELIKQASVEYTIDNTGVEFSMLGSLLKLTSEYRDLETAHSITNDKINSVRRVALG